MAPRTASADKHLPIKSLTDSFQPKSFPNPTEKTFDGHCKTTRLRVPSSTIMGGDHTDIERCNATEATNGLIPLDKEGQAEGSGSLGNRLPYFRGITDGIGSQPLMAAKRNWSQVFP
jgi:hypothetical protein